MDDWGRLTARAGFAAHDLVGWLMWDPKAVADFAALGVPNGAGGVVSWRLAALGDTSPAVAAAAAYSIHPDVIEAVMGLTRGVTDAEAILAVRDGAVVPGLDDIAPGLSGELGPLAPALWRGVDAVHLGARPMFAAHRALPRPEDETSALSAWLAVNCLRELRGDNHWALCASEDLDDVEVGLLHSVMVDVDEYGGEEWIARSRGNDDEAVAAGWARLAAKGLASGHALTDAGRAFRIELEHRTDALTTPAWRAVGAEATTRLCELVEPHHDAFVARIDATAGPRWMPAVRVAPAVVDEPAPVTVAEMYGDWDDVVVTAALERSLSPRPSAWLIDVVGSLGVGPDDVVLDIGGREGQHALMMAERFGCRAVSVDPVRENNERGRALVDAHEFGHLVELREGSIERIPADDGTCRVVFARDMLGHVEDLAAGLSECRRVLVPGGHMVVFEVFATPLLHADELRRLCADTATVPERLSAANFEATVREAGLSVERLEITGSEFVEASQEAGTAPNYLLQISRLRRDRERLVAELGEVPYRVMYGSALWSVYRFIGKLESRVYVLRRDDAA